MRERRESEERLKRVTLNMELGVAFSKLTNFDKIEVTLVGLRKVWGV
jgi:hypothetical protein